MARPETATPTSPRSPSDGSRRRSKDPKLLNIIVQIFDATGDIVASSKNTQGIANVSEQTLFAALQGKSTFETLTSSFPTKKAQIFRVFITPAIQNDRVEYVVQVGSPLDSITDALQHEGNALHTISYHRTDNRYHGRIYSETDPAAGR